MRLVGANPADVTGDTGFHDLTIDSATGKTVSFENGSTQTVAGDFRAEGAVGFPVVLQSDSAGVFWNLDVSAAASAVVDYVSVTDGDLVDAANPGAAVDVSPTTAGSSITDANSDIYTAANDPGGFGSDDVRWFFPISYTWDDGGGDTLWGTAGNWNPNGVPRINDDATIPDAGGPFTVGLGGGESINNLTVESTATLDLLGNDFRDSNVISNDGTIRSQGTEGVTISGVSPPHLRISTLTAVRWSTTTQRPALCPSAIRTST